MIDPDHVTGLDHVIDLVVTGRATDPDHVIERDRGGDQDRATVQKVVTEVVKLVVATQLQRRKETLAKWI